MTDLPFAELSVLAGVLASNGAVLDDLTLTGADFYDPKHGDIYDVMRRMRADRKPIDAATVGGEVPAHAVFLWELLDRVPDRSATPFHAEMVHEAGVRRRVAEAGVRVQAWASELPIPDLAEKARKEIDDALGVQKRRVRFMDETVLETIDSLGQPARYAPSPWRALNDVIGGFRPGALYVVGARPGVGKTVVALQAAMELAKHGAVAFSSLEMPERELHLRAMSAGAWIPHHMFEKPGGLPDWAKVKLAEWRTVTPKRVAFDDRGSVTVNDIRIHARSVAREGTLAGVVVDYLQLISGTAGVKRLDVVTEASRQLKLLARDLDVPVIALSQLNRNSEGRADKKPAMSDLRESGAIEQDADVVILLHRDMTGPSSSEVEMLVAKNRHGETRALDLEWHGEFMAVL